MSVSSLLRACSRCRWLCTYCERKSSYGRKSIINAVRIMFIYSSDLDIMCVIRSWMMMLSSGTNFYFERIQIDTSCLIILCSYYVSKFLRFLYILFSYCVRMRTTYARIPLFVLVCNLFSTGTHCQHWD
jgi:hypothetical protein